MAGPTICPTANADVMIGDRPGRVGRVEAAGEVDADARDAGERRPEQRPADDDAGRAGHERRRQHAGGERAVRGDERPTFAGRDATRFHHHVETMANAPTTHHVTTSSARPRSESRTISTR